MSSDERNRLHLYWIIALLLCFCLAMFSVFFTSCSKKDLSRDGRSAEPSGEPTAAVLSLPEEQI